MRGLLWLGAVAWLAGCALGPGGDDLSAREPVTGSVVRGADPLQVTLYKSGFEAFAAMPTASGLVSTADGPVLVYVQLTLVNLEDMRASGLKEVPVGDAKDITLRGKFGVGVSWIERRPEKDGEQLFRQVFREGYVGTSTGTFTIEDTDWTTHLSGRLRATLDNEQFGKRTLDLAWTWADQK